MKDSQKISAERYLKPYQGQARRRRKIAGDIETRGLFGSFLLGALYDGGEVTFYESAETMVDSMLARKRAGSVYLFHNGYNYDLKYLLPVLVERIGGSLNEIVPLVLNNNRMISLKVRTKQKRVYTLWDTTNIAKTSLEKLSAKFAPDFAKLPFNHATTIFDPANAAHREYLEYDVKGLYHAIENLESLLMEHFDVSLSATISSVASKSFRRSIKRPYLRLGGKADKFFRKTIRGGFNYQRDINGHSNCIQLDVNAMYASNMRGEYPVSSPIRSHHYRSDRLGAWRCEVQCWPDRVTMPFLDAAGATQAYGVFEANLWVETIEFARSRGYVIIPLDGYWFEKTAPVYAAFIDQCEALELPNKGNSIGEMVKSIRNNVYGNSVMRKERMEYCVSLDTPGDGWQEVIDVKSPKEELSFVPCLWQKEIMVESENMMPHWGALTLARSRVAAVRLVEVVNGFYCDTDSAFCGVEDYDRAIAAGAIAVGLKYGELKVEGRFDYFRILSPKCYFARLEDGTIKRRHKGISHDALSPDQLEAFLERGELELTVNFEQSNSLMSMLKTGVGMTRDAHRTLSSRPTTVAVDSSGKLLRPEVWFPAGYSHPLH